MTRLIRSGLVGMVNGMKMKGGMSAPRRSILIAFGPFFSEIRCLLSSSSIASETRFASCSAASRCSRSACDSVGGGAIARVRGSSSDTLCRFEEGMMMESGG